MKYEKDKEYTFIFTYDMYLKLTEEQPWPNVNTVMGTICGVPYKFSFKEYNDYYECYLFSICIQHFNYTFREDWLTKVNRSSAIKRNTNVIQSRR